MSEDSIPSWILKNPGYYFMIGIEPNGRIRTDGGHSSPKGVATAKKLHESIAVIKPPEGTVWRMIHVQEIPDKPGKVNQKAIDTLNRNAKGKK